jgi:hypothetical protein
MPTERYHSTLTPKRAIHPVPMLVAGFAAANSSYPLYAAAPIKPALLGAMATALSGDVFT